MITRFRTYFSKVVVINRRCRNDRWIHAVEQAGKHDFDWIVFLAHDLIPDDPDHNGDWACVQSHRGVLEIIAAGIWGGRVLVLEDDFEIVEPDPSKPWQHDAHADRTMPFNEQFAAIIDEVPADWDMLYLGGSYAEAPKERISKHVIRTGRMMTTSSYAITPRQARRMAPHIHGNVPIDRQFGKFNVNCNCYCLQPRLFVQYTNMSDLHGRVMDNATSMLDPIHEKMV
jgi:hypothetical protein